MVSREDEDKIDEYIKYMELEKNIINTVKDSELCHLEDNIRRLGFIKIFESDGTKWSFMKILYLGFSR